MLLYDTHSSLDSQKLCKVSTHVQSVEFVPQTPHLEADIVLSMPYFGLKAYPLSRPDRVVIDAYRSSPSHSEADQSHSLKTLAAAGTGNESATENTAKVPRKKSSKVAMGFGRLGDDELFPTQPSLTTQTPPNNAPKSQDDTSHKFPSWLDRLDTYLLMLFSLSTMVMIVIVILSRLNNCKVEPRCPENSSCAVRTHEVSYTGLLETLRKDQKRIAILDDRIQEQIDLLVTSESISSIDAYVGRGLKKNGNS